MRHFMITYWCRQVAIASVVYTQSLSSLLRTGARVQTDAQAQQASTCWDPAARLRVLFSVMSGKAHRTVPPYLTAARPRSAAVLKPRLCSIRNVPYLCPRRCLEV